MSSVIYTEITRGGSISDREEKNDHNPDCQKKGKVSLIKSTLKNILLKMLL